MLNWDDMRIFIAVARSGSFVSAGQRIRMDATTIARRIGRLESNLRTTLFVRSRRGLRLTAAGARLSEAGAHVEVAMETAGEEGALPGLAGTVRLSAPEGFSERIIVPAMPSFVTQYPGMCIELVATSGYLSPSTREVDIAITSSKPDSPRLTIEKLTDFEVGLYGSPAYLKKKGTPHSTNDLKNFDFIGYVDDLLYSQDIKFLDAVQPKLRRWLTCSSLRLQVVLAEKGGGLGAFPRFMADDFNLVSLLPDITVTRTYWTAVHCDLNETTRIRSVRRWLKELVEESYLRLTPSLKVSKSRVVNRASRGTGRRSA